MTELNVLISSGGRRPYLTQWFKEALEQQGVAGKVLVADLDRYAPAIAFADGFVQAPRVSDADYESWLRATLAEHKISLAISINDFELSVWSRLDPDDPSLASLVRLDAETQHMIEDKLHTATALRAAGVPVPATVRAVGDDFLTLGQSLVVKGRFGSASRGLALVERNELTPALDRAASEVTDRAGRPAVSREEALELIVIQDRVDGQEFGLDIVNDLNGEFATVLARKKIAMRGGETDKAVTVDPESFVSIGRAISQVLNHRGSIDADVIQDAQGDLWVIDVNPRFGGGYPFSHQAGADLPAAYVAWARSQAAIPGDLLAEPGITSAKYVATTPVPGFAA